MLLFRAVSFLLFFLLSFISKPPRFDRAQMLLSLKRFPMRNFSIHYFPVAECTFIITGGMLITFFTVSFHFCFFFQILDHRFANLNFLFHFLHFIANSVSILRYSFINLKMYWLMWLIMGQSSKAIKE